MNLKKAFYTKKNEKEEILLKLRLMLEKEVDVDFAYVYGSFVKEKGFNDTDIAVYIKPKSKESEIFEYELFLASKVDLEIDKYPIDLRSLNFAPLYFKFEVISNGILLFSKEEMERIEFECRTRDLYFDFQPFINFYYERLIMNPFEKDKIVNLFKEFGEAVSKLKSLSMCEKKMFLSSFEKIDSAKYNFIVAIEAAIDICNHIISKERLGAPKDYAEVFKVMHKAGVFPSQFLESLVQMAKFRNLLVHLYWKVNDEMVYDILQKNLVDFDKFENYMKIYLRVYLHERSAHQSLYHSTRNRI